MRERGLKPRNSHQCLFGLLSLPMRERGLKLRIDYGRYSNSGSLPMRERGLKLKVRFTWRIISYVAPHAGAWIETRLCLTSSVLSV